MTPLAVVLTVLCGLVALVWSTRHMMIWRENAKSEPLTAASPGPPAEAPKISVIVAAKDEQENIETCLRTMLVQDYPNFELICADDRSDDATGEIADRLAAEDPRLKVVHVKDLRAGWAGKCNAMRQAIAAADGQWICMIDADCRQTSDRTLSVAIQHALDRGSDMLSVLPRLEMKGFWENAIQPVCSGVMLIWFHPEKVNNPRRRNAYANGAFMLIRRETYLAIGGHETVKDKLNEDMHMAAAVKHGGHKLRVARGESLYTVRMYTSLGAILKGWSRIFYGTFGTLKRLSLSLTVMLVMGLLPYLTAILGLSLAAAGARPTGWWLAAGLVGAAAGAMQLSVIYRYLGLIGGRRGLFWTYPLGAAVASVILIQSLGKLRRGAQVTWRNTRYAGGN